MKIKGGEEIIRENRVEKTTESLFILKHPPQNPILMFLKKPILISIIYGKAYILLKDSTHILIIRTNYILLTLCIIRSKCGSNPSPA